MCGYTPMVKGLFRGKFAAVKIYSGYFIEVTCGYTLIYLPRFISVFTQLFSREALEGLLEKAGFLKTLLKTVDIQDK